MFIIGDNGLHSVFYSDGEVKDVVADWACIKNSCEITYPEMKPFNRSILASDHSTWALAFNCNQIIRGDEFFHINNLFYYNTNSKVDEQFVQSVIKEKMPVMRSRPLRLIN